jgi:hypothetical protein
MRRLTLKPFSASDLASRRPVWSALSELFLDTSLSSDDLDRIANELAQSPYSIEELGAILLWEVYPACRGNLVGLAGEWAAFDPAWLEKRILNRPSAVGIVWAAIAGRLGRYCSLPWRAVRAKIASIRGG